MCVEHQVFCMPCEFFDAVTVVYLPLAVVPKSCQFSRKLNNIQESISEVGSVLGFLELLCCSVCLLCMIPTPERVNIIDNGRLL